MSIISGLVLSPTRELAMQTAKEARRFGKVASYYITNVIFMFIKLIFVQVLGLTVVCVYGGTGISEQIAELKRGAEIVICTPGRMIDMLAANNG